MGHDPSIVGMYISHIMLREIMSDISFEADTFCLDLRQMVRRTDVLFTPESRQITREALRDYDK